MLSSNSILKQGRYRVSQIAAASPDAAIYEAQDNLAAKTVLVCERTSITNFGSNPRHYRVEGLLEIAERFEEGGRSYLVTEPLQSSGPFMLKERTNAAASAAVCERLRTVLDGLGYARKHFPFVKHVAISPLHMRAAADGSLKLAFFEVPLARAAHASDSPYLSLESVWESLDLTSQKAISNEYDEAALELLESEPDARADLYSVGAVFYNILTGTPPPSALERSIEMLDGGRDPLRRPETLNAAIPEVYANAIVQMLALRRDDRQASIKEAISALPAAKPFLTPAPRVAPKLADDDLDLLEIPTPATHNVAVETSSPVRSEPAAPVAAASAVFDHSEEVTEEHPEPFLSESSPAGSFVDDIQDEPEEAAMPVAPVQEVPAAEPPAAIPEVAVSFAPRSELPSPPVPGPIAPSPQFSYEQDAEPAKGFPVKLAAIGGVGVVVLAVAIWAVMSMFSGSQPTAQELPATIPAQTVTAAETSEAPVAQTAAPAEEPKADQPAQPAAFETVDKQTPETRDAKRAQIAEAKPAKPEEKPEQKPAAAPSPAKTKKSVTVDDLINDN